MKRRSLLAGATTLTTAALAGCLSTPGSNGEPPVGGNTTTDTPTGSQTPTDDPGSTDSPTPTDDGTTQSNQGGSFEILRIGPGQGENSATVSFDDGVTVEGTIGGRNGCYRARLASTEQSGETFRVRVEAYEDADDDEVCTQSLVDIDYRATFAFPESLPGRVVVEHDSMGETRTVAEEDR